MMMALCMRAAPSVILFMCTEHKISILVFHDIHVYNTNYFGIDFSKI